MASECYIVDCQMWSQFARGKCEKCVAVVREKLFIGHAFILCGCSCYYQLFCVVTNFVSSFKNRCPIKVAEGTDGTTDFQGIEDNMPHHRTADAGLLIEVGSMPILQCVIKYVFVEKITGSVYCPLTFTVGYFDYLMCSC